jgi:hypothetical protein
MLLLRNQRSFCEYHACKMNPKSNLRQSSSMPPTIILGSIVSFQPKLYAYRQRCRSGTRWEAPIPRYAVCPASKLVIQPMRPRDTHTSATICFLSRSLIRSKLSSFRANIWNRRSEQHSRRMSRNDVLNCPTFF